MVIWGRNGQVWEEILKPDRLQGRKRKLSRCACRLTKGKAKSQKKGSVTDFLPSVPVRDLRPLQWPGS